MYILFVEAGRNEVHGKKEEEYEGVVRMCEKTKKIKKGKRM